MERDENDASGTIKSDDAGLAPLYIYVDGSCADNTAVGPDQIAGWGFLVVRDDPGIGRGRGQVLHEMSGLVICDKEDNEWVGAEIASNNTAELSAVIHALRWLLLEGGNDPVVIRADSLYALRIPVRAWNAKANRELAEKAISLWTEVTSLRRLRGEHIRAHRGHRWNERADHLAFRAQAGEQPVPLTFWKPGER